jgi:hypothetical protein
LLNVYTNPSNGYEDAALQHLGYGRGASGFPVTDLAGMIASAGVILRLQAACAATRHPPHYRSVLDATFPATLFAHVLPGLLTGWRRWRQ